VAMGTMADIGMPVGLTFAGKAHDDERLLRMAGDFECATQRRARPPRTPELPDDVFPDRPSQAGNGKTPAPTIKLAAETRDEGDQHEIAITIEMVGEITETASIKVHVNGEPVEMRRSGTRFTGRALVPAAEHRRLHSVWRGPYGSIVTAVLRLQDGRTAGAYVVAGGIG
jgi:amidase